MSNPFHNPDSVTIQNLEAAFAGESMAHIKYRYFAKLCREAGDVATAEVFEATAEQEILHAFGHADLLYPKARMTPAKALQRKFRQDAAQEGHEAAVQEMDEQIAESKAHAEMFKAVLEKAAKRFAALAKVEEKHANHYQATLDALNAARAAGAKAA